MYIFTSLEIFLFALLPPLEGIYYHPWKALIHLLKQPSLVAEFGYRKRQGKDITREI